MANGIGTLERIAEELADAFAALEGAAEPTVFIQILRDLGIEDPADLTADGDFAQKLSEVAALASRLPPLIEQLSEATEGGNLAGAISSAKRLIEICGDIGGALEVVAADLARAGTGTTNETALAELAATFVDRVIGAVLAEWLEYAHPLAAVLLRLVGVIERTEIFRSVGGFDTSVVRRQFFLGASRPCSRIPLVRCRRLMTGVNRGSMPSGCSRT